MATRLVLTLAQSLTLTLTLNISLALALTLTRHPDWFPRDFRKWAVGFDVVAAL